jgi:hypothetical protein
MFDWCVSSDYPEFHRKFWISVQALQDFGKLFVASLNRGGLHLDEGRGSWTGNNVHTPLGRTWQPATG